jgi:hypothetical protein
MKQTCSKRLPINEDKDWHFLTFAAGGPDFEYSGRRLLKEAIKSKLFLSSQMYGKNQLQSDSHFMSLAGWLINSQEFKRGYGLYVWKPYILLKYLDEMKSGQGLLFLDAGCHLNFKTIEAKFRMTDYFALAKANGSLVMQLGTDCPEVLWTNPKIMDELELSDEQRNSGQIQSGIIFIMNNEENRKLLNLWWEMCIRNQAHFLRSREFYFLGEKRQSQFEQAIFSSLSKQFGIFAIPDETWHYPNWKIDGTSFPIWAMRIRDKGKPFLFFDFYTLYKAKKLQLRKALAKTKRYLKKTRTFARFEEDKA